MPKIVVTGYADHGKDTVAEMLGLPFASSSLFVCERAVLPVLGPKYGYATAEECHADRDAHRQEWYQLIYEYNAQDKARLARELFAENDVYVGWRHIEEFEAGRNEGLFDLAIWVDASKRKPPEPDSSITIGPEDCDIVIPNNGSEWELARRVARVAKMLQPSEPLYVRVCREDFSPTEHFVEIETAQGRSVRVPSKTQGKGRLIGPLHAGRFGR